MNIIWNIVKKDFRLFRWPLLVMTLIWVVKAYCLLQYYDAQGLNSVRPTAFNGTDLANMMVLDGSQTMGIWPLFSHFVLFFASFMDFCLLFYVVTNLLQADSAFDGRAFWRTRPVARTQMLAAKALFLGLVFWVVPLVLQTTVDLHSRPHFGYGGQVNDYIKWYDGILRMLLIQGTWVMLCVLLASLWRSPVVGLGTVMLLAALFEALLGGIFDRRNTYGYAIVESICLGGSGLIFCVMYLRGSQKLGLTLFGLGTTTLFLVCYLY